MTCVLEVLAKFLACDWGECVCVCVQTFKTKSLRQNHENTGQILLLTDNIDV